MIIYLSKGLMELKLLSAEDRKFKHCNSNRSRLLLLFFIFTCFIIQDITGQSAESCPEPMPDGMHTCPDGDVPHYTLDMSGSADGNLATQIEGASGSTCCGDELNSNAKCNVVEIILNPQTVGVNIDFYGNLGSSGSIKVSQDAFDVCNGTVESLNSFDRDSICLDNNSGIIFFTICKPGTADYCVDLETYGADGFGDQIVLLDDVVNCQYEVNVTSTDVLENIVWTSLTGNLNDTLLLSCPSGQLDCLTPTFSPPGNLGSEEEYIYQVCGEYVDEDCGNVGIIVCDTVNIEVIPQIIVELDDVIVCQGVLPYEVEADVDPEEPTFQYYWYNDYDGPLGSGTLIEITDDPYHEATEAGMYSIHVIDTDTSYACVRTFTFNFEIIEEIEPTAVPELISFDECNLTVTVTGENSLDSTGADNLIYEWDFGDGGSGFFESGSYTYSDCDQYTITLTVIDPDIIGDCEVHSAEITFQFDDTAPTLTCPSVIAGQCDIADVPIYEDWAEFIGAGGSGFVDNCTVNPSSFTFLSETDNNDPDGLPCPMDWTRVYYVQDMCGNFTTCQQTVQIWDLIPPVIDPEAQDYTIVCDVSEIDNELQFWLDANAYADATDNCTDQGNLVWTYLPANPTLSDECGETGDVEVTFYVTDECGNSSSTTATFSVVDNSPPDVSNCDLSNLNQSTECQGVSLNEAYAIQWNIDNILYLNSCVEELCGSFNIADDFSYNLTNLTCENAGDIVVQYTIFDGCGNFVPVQATLSFTDNTPPSVVTPPADLSLGCDLINQETQIQDWLDNFGGATANEICNAVRWENDYSGISYACGGTGTANVTFTVIDSCGNTNSASADIIINDLSSPEVTCDPSNPIVECDGAINNEAYADTWNDDNIAALIACSSDLCGDIVVSSDYDYGNLVTDCGEAGVLVVNYYIEDECGNITPKLGILTFEDNTDPEITCTPENLTIECNGLDNQANADSWNADNISLLEGCSSDICGTISVTSNYNFGNLIPTCGSGGNLTVVYTVTDQCGEFVNLSATLTIEDTTDPEITCPADVTLECPADTNPTFTGVATAIDDCDSNPVITYSDVVIPGCGNTYDIERTWLATDDCDNTDNCVQIITVQDITPPTIDVPAADLTIECDLSDQDALIQDWLDINGGAIASDVCNDIDWTNDYVPLTINCGGAGSTDVIFTVEDACGNTNTTSATVTVIDNTSPIVSCDPTNPVLECDGIDNNESIAEAWNDDVIAALIACSTDPCGTFIVYSDYDFGNYIAGCGEAGSLTVNFSIEDECGNITPKVGVITFEDNTDPEITCTPDDLTIECNGLDNQGNADTWNADNIALLVGCSSDICGTISVISNYDFANLIPTCGSGGTLTVIYTVADQCSFEVEFTATLTIEDTTDPEITCPADVTLECPADTNPTFTGVATAIDDCDSNPVITYSDVVIPGCGNSYDIERTWLATDDCDNTDNCVQIITVQDITPPTIDVPAADLTIECDLSDQDALIQDWLDINGGAIASDVCNDIDWTNDYVPLTISCGGAGSTNVIFTVEDACGNTNTTSATVTVIDNTSPVVSCDPTNPILECDGIDNNESIAEAWNDDVINALIACSTDPCGTFIVYSDYDFGNYIAGCGEAGSLTVNFSIEDECGNITPKVGVITFEDNTDPEITCTPDDLTIECNGLDNQGNADSWNADNIALLEGCSSDICGTISVVSNYDFANLIPTCGSGGTLTVIYTVADQCSFEVEFTATLTIEDTTDPEITCPVDITLECPADTNPTFTGVATATDDCDSNPVITYSDVVIPGCGNTYDIERTWLATDDCNNTANCIQIITVQDITPPTIDVPAVDLTIECDLSDQDALIQDWLDINGGAIASDVCNDIDWTNDYVPLTINCGGAGSTDVIFTVEDACGNTNTTSATVTVIDNSSPVVSCDPTNPILECDGIDNNESIAEAWNDSNIAALLACSTDPCGTFTVYSDYDFGNYIGGCGEAGSLTVNFSIEDECGNITPKVGVITFEDNTDPEITCTPDDLTIECNGLDNQGNADTWNADNIALLEGCSSDICGTISVTSNYDFANLIPTCGSGGTLTVIYTIADQCSFEVEFTATLTIEDTTDPEITCPADLTLECPADTNPTFTGVATATDDCDSDPEVTYSDVVIPGCGNTYEIERTWLATDDCDNTSSCVQIITIQDITPPTVDVPAADLTIECDLSDQDAIIQDWLDINGGAIASDMCNDIDWSNDYVPLTINCGGAGSTEVTFTVEDACGNTNTTIATVTVIDNSSPVVSCDPTNPILECDGIDNNESIAEAWNDSNIAALLACSTDPCGTFTVYSDYDFGNYIGGCGEAGSLTVNFSIEDECGNITPKIGIITFEDNTDPEITCTPEDLTIECNGLDNQANADTWNADNIALLDGCSSDICGTISVTSNYDFANLIPTCGSGGTLTVIYTVADQCSFEVEFTATLTIEDTTDPEITCPADITLECPADTNPTFTGVATATDDCDSDPEVTYSDVVIPGCGNTYDIERTWLATDDCDNTSSCVQIITVQDITPPTIDVPAADLTIECDLSDQDAIIQAWLASNGGAVASDLCNDIDWSNDYVPLTINCGGAGSTEVTFTVEDACGNANTTSATVTVIDNSSPVVSCDPTNPILECDGIDNNESNAEAWNDSNIAALLACSTDPCGTFTVYSDYDFGNYIAGCGEAGTLTVNFSIEDECGNITPKIGIITFEDNTDPVITCTPEDVTIECEGTINSDNAETWNADNVSLLEGCSSDICGTITVTSDYDFANLIPTCGSGGTLTVVYTVADQCSFEVEFTATLTIEDTTDPEITCPGDITLGCPADTDPIFTGVATATDDCDSNPIITYTDLVIPGCGNSYEIQRTWVATDDCDNSSSCLQVIIVQDITPPSIICPENVTISFDSTCGLETTPTELGEPTVSDNCDDNPVVSFEDDLSNLTECNGTGSFTRVWRVEDACGNISFCDQLIFVIDNSNPIVTCPDEVTVYYDADCALELDPSILGYPTVTDNCDIDPEITYVDDLGGLDQCNGTGFIIRTFTITDACGNITLCDQIINVLDNIAPIIECPEEITVFYSASCALDLVPQFKDYPTITDNCDIDPDITYSDDLTGLTGCNSTGSIIRTWTITDACGNSSTCEQTLIVADDTAPVINCPPEVTIFYSLDCQINVVPNFTGEPTISDNCDAAPIVSFEDDISPLTECNGTGFFSRLWTVEDVCGNTSECVQSIVVQDNTNPVVECPVDVTLYYDGDCIIDIDPTAIGSPIVTDNCDADPEVNYVDDDSGLTECNNTGVIVRSWSIIDACGNETICVQNITVIDNIAPEIICPEDVTLDCPGDSDPTITGTPEVSDNCGFGEFDYTDEVEEICPGNSVITRTWTLADNCGLEVSCVQIITIQDDTSPELECPEDITLECDGTGNTIEIQEWLETFSATDNCSNVTIDNNFGGISGECEGIGEVTVIFTAVDECGNASICEATLTIVDTSPPVADDLVDITLNYLEEIPNIDIEIVIGEQDLCDPNPVVTWLSDSDNGGTGCFGDPLIISRVYNVADCSDNNVDLERTITVETPQILVEFETNEIFCSGYNTGTIDITVSGGTAPYDLDWDDDTYDGQSSLDELFTGVYTLNVIDANGCSLEIDIEVLESINTLNIQLGPEDPVICLDGEITLTVDAQGGAAPYIYEWNVPTSTNENLLVELEGNYEVTVTDQNGCFDIAEIFVDVLENPEIENPGPQESCDTYILPEINGIDLSGNQAYYSGIGGTGTQYEPGDVISTSGIMYIFDETGTIPNCTTETSFEITIFVSPNPLAVPDVVSCDEYTLLAIEGSGLSGNEAYFTELDGEGDQYFEGDIINEDITLFAYDILNRCPGQDELIITIIETPVLDQPEDVTECVAYILPEISGSAVPEGSAYYSQPGGLGTSYLPGDIIDEDLSLYIYAFVGDCFDEVNFEIDILTLPIIFPIDPVTSCDAFILTTILGDHLTGNQAYYDSPGGDGNEFNVGDAIDETITLYAYDVISNCPVEVEFLIEIVETPEIDPADDVTLCDEYDLPEILGVGVSNAHYFLEANGQGAQLEEGDIISTSSTIYMYVNAGSCEAEDSFEVTIIPTPIFDPLPNITSCDNFILQDLSGEYLSGNEAYFTEKDGEGSQYLPGDTIFETITLFAYDQVMNCEDEFELLVEIVETPEIDPFEDVTVCNNYTLPAITGIGASNAGFYTQANGQGTRYFEGDVISQSTTLYMYVKTGTCEAEEVFDILILDTPDLDPNGGLVGCDQIILPQISGTFMTGDQAYYTEPDGQGDIFTAGDTITSDLTLYIFDINGECYDEELIEIQIVSTPDIEPLEDVTVCDRFILPEILGEGILSAAYYTEAGGQGIQYNEGDEINQSTDIYIYVSAGTCGDEEVFKITILETPELDPIEDLVACDQISLSPILGDNLSGNQAYYTESNGAGEKYNPGDIISSSINLFVFDISGDCFDEEEFSIEIVNTPIIDPIADVVNCDFFILPEITGVGVSTASYFTEINGQGVEYNEGDTIKQDASIFMYIKAGSCEDEKVFNVTILLTPQIDEIEDLVACDQVSLPVINGNNLSGNQAFYTEPNGGGDKYVSGDLITSNIDLYVYDIQGDCFDETEFSIEIVSTPIIDPVANIVTCELFVLPEITGLGVATASYFSESGGQGLPYNVGDTIAQNLTIYMFMQAGSCEDEKFFSIEILPIPDIDPIEDVFTCDSYILDQISGNNLTVNVSYYSQPNGTGDKYDPGTEIFESTTIYAFDSNGECDDQDTFEIEIIETPEIDPIDNVVECDSFVLPIITGIGVGNANYYSEAGGQGIQYATGDIISASTIIYIYTNAGGCFDETSFSIEILSTPDVDPIDDVSECDTYVLREITGSNLSGSEAYYTLSGGLGTQYLEGQNIDSDIILYVFDSQGTCFDEEQFTISIIETPIIDPTDDVTICDYFVLPAITGSGIGTAKYNTAEDESGIDYSSGDTIFTQLQLFVSVGSDDCSDQESFTIDILTAPTVSNFSAECNALEPGYKVSFEISGGDPYNYYINGELIDNPEGTQPYVYSEELASGDPYSFEITDINGCESYLFEDIGLDCGCITRVGTMNQQLIELCGSEGSGIGLYDDTNQVFDFDDTLMFVLHEGSDTSLLNIIALSFDSEFFFDENTMNHGQTYYISAVVGNKLSTGFIDFADECLAVSIGQPIVFYKLPSGTISGDYEICIGEEIEITVDLEGDAPWNIVLDANGQSMEFDNISSSPYIIKVTGTEDLNLSFISVEDEHCQGTGTGNITVKVDEPNGAEIVEETEICNVNFKGSLIDLDTLIISGTTSGVWVDISNSGAIMNGNILDFNGIAPGQYQFEYTLESEGGFCESNTYLLTITVLDCACPIINIGEAGPFCNDFIEFDLSSIENDSESGSWSIFDSPTNDGIAQIQGDLFIATDADPGVYEIQFSLDEIDPLCTSDTIIFVEIFNQFISGDAEPPLIYCEGEDAVINLYDLLTGEDPGGNWISIGDNPGNSFVSSNAMVNLENLSSGNYSFQYSRTSDAPCVNESTEVQIVINEIPFTDAGEGFMLTCEMQAGYLDASLSVVGDYNYTWSTSIGNIVNGENTTSPFVDQPGWYYLLTENLTTGCQAIDSVYVGIDAGFPNADAGPDLIINCASVEVIIDATNSTDGDYDYMWIGPDGNQLSTGTSKFIIETNIPGEYIFIIIDPISDCSNTDTVRIEGQLNYPLAEIAEPDILSCDNLTVQIDATESSNNANIKYSWIASGNGNIIGDSETSLIEVDQAGLYVLQVLDTVNFCVTFDSIEVVVDREFPVAEAGSSSSLDCINTEIDLDGNGSSQGQDLEYSWSTTGGNIISGYNSLSPRIDDVGVYYLEVYNSRNGCLMIDSVEIFDDVVPIEDFDFEQINPCFGDREGLIAVTNVEGGVGPFTYALNGNEFTENSVWENLGAGTYTISIKGSNGCSLSEEITIFEGLDLQVDAGEDQYIYLGDTAHLASTINIADNLVESLVWNPVNNNISCIDCFETLVWPFETTLYTSTLTDVFGCTDYATVRVFVDRRSRLYAPNIFSPNGDGENDRFTIYTGTEVDRILELKIFSRWGELMFENHDFEPGVPDNGWDGTFKNYPINPGVFAWFAKVQLIDGTERKIKGDVTLFK